MKNFSLVSIFFSLCLLSATDIWAFSPDESLPLPPNAAVAAASIGNFVWEDINGNGIQDVGEPGIGGVSITLSGTTRTGTPVNLTTTSGPTGTYIFSQLEAGTYRLTFSSPAGYTPTAYLPGDEIIGSSSINPFGMTDNKVLADGESDMSYDAGYYRSASIGDFTWGDINGNGIQEATEFPFAGVTVVLTGTTSVGSFVSLTTKTDASGMYAFQSLWPGTYKLTFTIPVGYLATSSDQGPDDARDSDANPITGMTLSEVLTSGEINTNYDAGFFPSASIGDFAWEDVNVNGIQDTGEPGINGVKVVLTGTTGSGGPVSLVTETDVTGLYAFQNLWPGTYKLTFTTPSGYTVTARDQGSDDAFDSDVHPVSGTTPEKVLQNVPYDKSYDAGFVRPAHFGGVVWSDANRNGVRERSESSMNGIEVRLVGTTSAGIQVNASTVTNNGVYKFPNLVPGTYSIVVVPPPNSVFTYQDVGDDALDSDVDIAGRSTPFVFQGGVIKGQDVGIYLSVSYLQGQVFWDKNKNCTFDNNELKLEGWWVDIENGIYRHSSRTDINGFYSILAPIGTYKIHVRPPTVLNHSFCSLPSLISIRLDSTTKLDIPVQDLPACPLLSTQIATSQMRRCFTGAYMISYNNNSASAVSDAYLIVHLDPFLNFVRASWPATDLANHSYRFDLGTIPPFFKGAISMTVDVACTAILGQAHCTEVRIFPDSICVPQITNWGGAIVQAKARCLNRTEVEFTLKNIGLGDMKNPLRYYIIEDYVKRPIVEAPALRAGDSLVVQVPGNGSTWRIEAEQEKDYPGFELPVASLEGCTTKNTFSTGFIQQHSLNDLAPTVDIDCTANTGSFDPNDKQGFPVGYGPKHYIKPGTEIEYLVRFENTGTDTAFTVVIIDTLSHLFDLNQLHMQQASHPYICTIRDSNVLEIRFPDIRLPYRKIDSLGAQGFVRYVIRPVDKAPLESTLTNRAHIYFDFNAPVVTNTTEHRIGENFITLISVHAAPSPLLQMSAIPNPFRDAVLLRAEGAWPPAHSCLLRLYHPSGQLMLEQRENTPVFEVQTANFPQGVYFYRVFCDGQAVAAGSMVKM